MHQTLEGKSAGFSASDIPRGLKECEDDWGKKLRQNFFVATFLTTFYMNEQSELKLNNLETKIDLV